MGASSWDYFVPYQEDLGAALDQLRRQVFDRKNYYWVRDSEWCAAEDRRPWPTTMEQIWEDEWAQESGTHSILDMHRVLAPGDRPDYFTVEPVSAAETRQYAGTDRLTRAHVAELKHIPIRRWFGRCAVLHDESGQPQEIYFWGYSGD